MRLSPSMDYPILVAVIPAGLAGVVSLPTRVSVNVTVLAGRVRSGGGRLACVWWRSYGRW